MSKAIARAIEHGAIGEQRDPAAAYGIEQRVRADDVQIRILLTGEAGTREVLCRGARTHCEWLLTAQIPPGIEDGRRDCGWHDHVSECRTDRLGDRARGRGVCAVER